MMSEKPVEPEKRPSGLGALILRSLVSLTLLCGLALVAYNLYGVCQGKQTEYEAKLEEVRIARQLNYRLTNQNRQLRALVEHLRTDQGIEEIAREKLGLVRPGETAFVVSPNAPDRTVYTVVEPPPMAEPEPSWMQALLRSMFAPSQPS